MVMVLLTKEETNDQPVYKGLLGAGSDNINDEISNQPSVTHACSSLEYPSAAEGLFTTNSPGSPYPANEPSALITRASTPGISCPPPA